MTFRQQVVAFGMGILIWVNLLTIGLSFWQFGYLDSQTAAMMGVIALPPLAAGAFLLHYFRPPVESAAGAHSQPAGIMARASR